MVAKERSQQRCAKCRKPVATVPFFRFPTLGKPNFKRLKELAKWLRPDENWEQKPADELKLDLEKLHSANKVICGRHFTEQNIVDGRVNRYALPFPYDEPENEDPNDRSTIMNVVEENVIDLKIDVDLGNANALVNVNPEDFEPDRAMDIPAENVPVNADAIKLAAEYIPMFFKSPYKLYLSNI